MIVAFFQLIPKQERAYDDDDYNSDGTPSDDYHSGSDDDSDGGARPFNL